ncbi:MAG: glutathione S-transferase [Phenylobacterium sp. RIFCSPHIGHO2_01_FULL_69_31]|uniref:glutathione S-transferase family protein n=1 Tax=Phenylobacterium sp. RIFCSPHIGHO2_01_FULL_69_31 TaxID=1801944 RepID=UPI0008B6CD71|nr:glutathione S-transferase family protein [Phenylobacterium sp. RIFCSPHIGHO2_01_FULL_69_31]OHB27242.1 MAG: glutathione S-transferase [Phenylobacterium sp. RIFCSPHIGHO2_01_FULL_69_31]
MKLYTSIGPNPRVVKMFLAEKGLDVERIEVDLRGGENRREPYLAVNPAGQTPALVLESGAALTEITAICEYLEEVTPNPPLIGTNAEERALTRMWVRRVDLKVCEPMANGFRFAEGLPMFESRMRCLPEAAPGLKAVAQDGIAWLEENFQGPWITGGRFTLADILLFSFLDFGGMVGQPLDPKYAKVGDWFARVKARPSVAASA